MTQFKTKRAPESADAIAPDGSNVRLLLALERGSCAHFELPAGETSRPITHRTVEEIWYFLTGKGEMWRKQGAQEEIVTVSPGICLTIPLGTHFQFRAFGEEALTAIGVTMPPWPGASEACEVEGPWRPTIHSQQGD